MDKNTIIGLIIIFGLVMGFSFYNNSKIKKDNELKKQELVENQNNGTQKDSTLTDTVPSANAQPSTAPAPVANSSQKSSNFFFEGNQTNNDYFVETNVAKYTFSRKGGYIKRVELKNIYRYTPKGAPKQPLVLFDGEQNKMNLELQLNDQRMVQTENLYFSSPQEDTLFVNGSKQQQLSLKLYPLKPALDANTAPSIDSNSYVEYLYTFSADDYRFGYRIRFVNMSSYLYANRSYSLQWNSSLNNVEKNYEYERNLTTIYYMDNIDEVSNLSEKSSEKKEFSTPIKWVSYKQQFFTAVMISDSGTFTTGTMEVKEPDKNELLKLKDCAAEMDFEVSDIDNAYYDISLYFGPNQYKLLNKYDLNLERQVPLGWSFLLHWINRLAVIPIFNWLETYGISYGIIILILTIILKLVLMPVAYKTYLSSARMRVLKPEIEEIAARYPKPDDAMKKQQATMTLYKKAGINPMSGCLPMLLQMPILIAFFRFFPAAYELRQQPFLWAEDLSTYDSILDLGFNIPFYGDHVSLFTLLMTIATLIYTWLNNKLMAPGGASDQQKMMKIMMYIMPVLFLGMFNSFSSALTYYYLLVNLITFLQMWIFRMSIDEKKVREKIKLNMTKPVKKSKWQIKLEEMQKQQQQLQKQKK
jgi:YidC/Oxa1 family membrane protein insertase